MATTRSGSTTGIMSSQNSITEKSSDAVKDVRRRVFARVRNDWAFEYAVDDNLLKQDVVLQATSEGEGTSDANLDIASTSQPPNEDIGITEWRERTYASSDPSSDEGEGGASTTSSTAGILRKRQHVTSAKNAEEQAAQQLKRERRRQRRYVRLNEEMSWNEGLRFFQARRDAWCCAKKPVATSTSTDTTTTSTHATSIQSVDAASEATLTSKTQTEAKYSPTLIPVHAPLIKSSDPSKSIINSNLYPSIYSKVVMQSLSPSVPINLSHLVGALVVGWKASDAWPPKASTSITASNNGQGGITTSTSTIVSSALNGLGLGGRVRGWGKKMAGAANRDKGTNSKSTSNVGGKRKTDTSSINPGDSNANSNGVPANCSGSKVSNSPLSPSQGSRKTKEPTTQSTEVGQTATVAAQDKEGINNDHRRSRSNSPELPPQSSPTHISVNGQFPLATASKNDGGGGDGDGDINVTASSGGGAHVSGSHLRKGVSKMGKVLRMSWHGVGSGSGHGSVDATHHNNHSGSSGSSNNNNNNSSSWARSHNNNDNSNRIENSGTFREEGVVEGAAGALHSKGTRSVSGSAGNVASTTATFSPPATAPAAPTAPTAPPVNS